MKFKIIILASILSFLNADLINDKFEKPTNIASTTTAKKPRKLSIKEATLIAINKIRTTPQICSNPVSPLVWNDRLYQIAKEHSIDMAIHNFASHQGSGKKSDLTAQRLKLNRGSFFYERVNQKKDSNEILSAELVTAVNKHYYKTPAQILNYWIKSKENCKIIMDPRFSDVALSKVISNKTNKAYWTLLLIGKRK